MKLNRMAATSRVSFTFDHLPITDQSFENALDKARNGTRLTVDDAVELLTTGTDTPEIDPLRKEQVLEAADQRRAEVAGEIVTFVANLNNNITTACNTGCLFCNFKDSAYLFEKRYNGVHKGFTKTPNISRKTVEDALNLGISEVCSVSGLHPALVLNSEHREILNSSPESHNTIHYKSADNYHIDPGTYCDQISAMKVDQVHIHSITPEEADHAKRGTEWSYRDVYRELMKSGLNSVPGTAAEILVDEVRDVICPGKISTTEWIHAMEAAAAENLPLTATIMYGHVENEMHRAMHLEIIRDLQDRTKMINEFVPLSFVYPNTPLYKRGIVSNGATPSEDELMIAVSRLFLDNIDNIQSSWVKFGDSQGLKMLSCGANDFMGTLLTEEITTRAGGTFGQFRSFNEYVDMITAIGRIPAERTTTYDRIVELDIDYPPFGPTLGPRADGTPMLSKTIPSKIFS